MWVTKIVLESSLPCLLQSLTCLRGICSIIALMLIVGLLTAANGSLESYDQQMSSSLIVCALSFLFLEITLAKFYLTQQSDSPKELKTYHRSLHPGIKETL